MDDGSDDDVPLLQPATIRPPGSTDLTRHYKALRETDGRLLHLERLPAKGWLGGVCSGIAYRLGCRTRVVRWAFFLSTLTFGLGAVLYVPLWLFLPKAEKTPDDFSDRTA